MREKAQRKEKPSDLSEDLEWSGKGWTAAHHAANEGLHLALERLVEADPQLVDVQDADGRTALYVGSCRGRVECVVALAKAGASVDLAKKDGRTPLIVALLRHTDLRPQVDPITGHISRDERSAGANPAELAALELPRAFRPRQLRVGPDQDLADHEDHGRND